MPSQPSQRAERVVIGEEHGIGAGIVAGARGTSIGPVATGAWSAARYCRSWLTHRADA
jgi:hypothetical protein